MKQSDETSPWPRWLSTKMAAAYVCLSEDSFRRKVRGGGLPPPNRHLGPNTARRDREALDAAMLDRSTSIDVNARIAQIAAEEGVDFFQDRRLARRKV